MSILDNLANFLNEDKKWVANVKPKRGKMHDLLNIPEDKNITDVYSSGEKLAKALLRAVNGDQKKASSMLAFAANADKTNNVLDSALHYMKKIKDKED
jgi:hypothetical protein